MGPPLTRLSPIGPFSIVACAPTIGLRDKLCQLGQPPIGPERAIHNSSRHIVPLKDRILFLFFRQLQVIIVISSPTALVDSNPTGDIAGMAKNERDQRQGSSNSFSTVAFSKFL